MGGLRLRVFEPFCLALHSFRPVGENDAHIGENHGQRRFQFMGGVRHELPLLLP